MRRLGVLCVGKDCPGINAAIRALARRAFARDMEVMAIRRGFEGMLKEDVALMSTEDVAGILNLGGTFLGMSTLDPTEDTAKIDHVGEIFRKYQMTLLVVMGGHTALKASMRLAEKGVPSLLLPCTIDNDIAGTDLTVGFLTAAGYLTDALDRLHSNAQAGHRIVVVEIRGDAAGWIATFGGMAGGADFVLATGAPGATTMEDLYAAIDRRHRAGKAFSIVVVEQRFPLPDRLAKSLEEHEAIAGSHRFVGGAGMLVAEDLLLKYTHEVRFVAIGDIQRGGSPHVMDRVMATRLGYAAAEMAKNGKTNLLLGVRGMEIATIPYDPNLLVPRRISQEIYEVAAAYF